MSFGPFHLVPAQQLLLEGDQPVRLGSRALDILIALVENAGELVSKDDLVARVWPGTFVEDANLRVHVAALRRALGDGHSGRRYIANVPGRGYRFVAPVIVEVDGAQPAAPAEHQPTRHLPAQLGRMVGRSDVVAALVAQLAERRFITIVGPGGIGKTTVALAAAHQLAGAYQDGAYFVDLAPLADASLLVSTLASALGLAIRSDSPLPSLVGGLQDKEVLLVLDSCEHMIEAAAELAEAAFKGAPRLHVLATSREPLRVEGERVQRLPPLALPAASAGLTAAEALAYPAIQLFVERAAACLGGFELSDADAPIVAEICRRLDGMALAIELAAGRLDAFGVAGLAAVLDDRFRLLMRGRRTAMPRHQTLSATLDWSYELLAEPERLIFRRLAVFAGAFALAAASGVVGDEDLDAAEVVDGIAALVAKSLVAAEVGAKVRYRLLDTTRAYARRKLEASGELDRLTRRHADFHKQLFERAAAEWETRPTHDWLAAYADQIGNLRAALDWANAPSGDPEVGVALTVAATPLLMQLSLVDECRRRTEQALAVLDRQASPEDRSRMQLRAALAWSLMYTTATAREKGAAWSLVLELAERLDDVDYRLRAAWGLWASRINNGEFAVALQLAKQFCSLAARSNNPADRQVGDRMMGAALHFLGDQVGARRHIEHMLARYVAPAHRSHVVRFQFDQRLTAQITLARVLWLQGLGDQAMRTLDRMVEAALALDHTLSLCNALAQAACPVALLAGDWAAGERFTTLLLERTARHGLEVWRVYGSGFQGQLEIARGDPDSGLRRLSAVVAELRDAGFVQYQTAFLGALAAGLIDIGDWARAGATVEEAQAQIQRTEERWFEAELLRLKAEIALRQGRPNVGSAAEEDLRAALDSARRQGALAWELRAATSLARWRRDQGRLGEARALLAPVYDRFTEGFQTLDLLRAKALLDELPA